MFPAPADQEGACSLCQIRFFSRRVRGRVTDNRGYIMLLTFLLQMCVLETLPSFPAATPPLAPPSSPFAILGHRSRFSRVGGLEGWAEKLSDNDKRQWWAKCSLSVLLEPLDVGQKQRNLFFFFYAVQVGKTLHSPRPPDLVLAAHSRFGKTVL